MNANYLIVRNGLYLCGFMGRHWHYGPNKAAAHWFTLDQAQSLASRIAGATIIDRE